jgi:hypothetical protein
MVIPPPEFFNDEPIENSPEPGFEILGKYQFSPVYLPGTVRVTKERNLNRKPSFCKGEDVTDTGSKNRDIHIAGRINLQEKKKLDTMVNEEEVYTLSCPTWTGDVRIKMVEYEGPTGHDSNTGGFLFKYSMDLVSTGPDEGNLGNGIIAEPGDEDTGTSANTGDSSDTTGFTES